MVGVGSGGLRAYLVLLFGNGDDDPLPGYTTIDGRPYFVRQMKNFKESMTTDYGSGDANRKGR